MSVRVRIECLLDVIRYLRRTREAMASGETRLAFRYLVQAQHDFGFTIGLCGGQTLSVRLLRAIFEKTQDDLFEALPRRAS